MTENGNIATMREALVQCELFLNNVSRHGHPTLNPGDKCVACAGVDELRGMVVRALSTPARNCDVGTPEEQQNRFRDFCRHHEREGECGIGRSVAACPAFHGWSNPDCSLWWAQMPYEEKHQMAEGEL